MSTFTINKTTGEFVGARRSARLAAKRGDAVFTPRIERFSASAEYVAAPTERFSEGGPAGPVRRTSPRLAGYYAKRAAAAERRASAFRLVESVLLFATERAGQLGIGSYSDVRMKGDATPKDKPKKAPSVVLTGFTPEYRNAVQNGLTFLVSDVIKELFSTGMYGTCLPLSRAEWTAWVSDDKNTNLLARTIANWVQTDAATVACWGREDVEHALLQGETWIAIMSAFI